MVAVTALVTGMTLIHNNASDFETIRSGIEKDPKRFRQLAPLNLIRCVTIGLLVASDSALSGTLRLVCSDITHK